MLCLETGRFCEQLSSGSVPGDHWKDYELDFQDCEPSSDKNVRNANIAMIADFSDPTLGRSNRSLQKVVKRFP